MPSAAPIAQVRSERRRLRRVSFVVMRDLLLAKSFRDPTNRRGRIFFSRESARNSAWGSLHHHAKLLSYAKIPFISPQTSTLRPKPCCSSGCEIGMQPIPPTRHVGCAVATIRVRFRRLVSNASLDTLRSPAEHASHATSRVMKSAPRSGSVSAVRLVEFDEVLFRARCHEP